MTLEEIYNFEPQVTYIDAGPEPSLYNMVFMYYKQHFGNIKSHELTKEYFKTLQTHCNDN